MEGSQRVGVRLRQAVFVAADLDAVFAPLRDRLRLGEPFRDPGVAEFGIHNVVCALGEDFLEVISPNTDGTAAGRHLERRGDGGYMLIFQLDDLEGARARARELGVRTVWSIDLPDISGTHLHPGDVGGTIVSLDRPDPPESWRWGGPDWIGGAGSGAPGRLVGATVRVAEPVRVASRWAEVLGLVAHGSRLELDRGQWIAFEEGDEGLAEVAVSLPGSSSDEPLRLGAATIRFV